MLSVKQAFAVFRTRAYVAAGAIATVGAVGLIVVVWQHDQLPDAIELALTNVLAVLLSIGVISLIYETFLRQSYAVELRNFVRFGAAVAASGLQQVTARSETDWRNVLESADVVEILVRDPQAWIVSQQHLLLEIAKQRAVKVTLAVPDVDSPVLGITADALGLEEDDLKSRISIVVKQLASSWRAASKGERNALHAGSALRIVAYSSPIGYDILRSGRRTLCLLGLARNGQSGDDQVLLEFQQDPTAYPTAFLNLAFEDVQNLTAVEEVVANG